MQSIPALLRLVPRALLFDGDAYRTMRDRSQPAADGARLLAMLGAALGAVEVMRALLAWATAPDLADLLGVLGRELPHLPALSWLLRGDEPWLSALASGARSLRPALRWLVPSPPLALARLLTAPLGLVGGWLAYGLLAHLLARLLGGRASLAQTLGCTALAESPCALLLVPLLPPLGPSAVGLWAWVLAARYVALRAAHGLDAARAFWAAALAAIAGLALAGGLAGLWLGAQVLL